MSAVNVVVGQTVKLDIVLTDGVTDQFPQALLYDALNTLIAASPVNLAHIAGGLYSATFQMPATTKVTASISIYSDAARTTLNPAYNLAIDEFIAVIFSAGLEILIGTIDEPTDEITGTIDEPTDEITGILEIC